MMVLASMHCGLACGWLVVNKLVVWGKLAVLPAPTLSPNKYSLPQAFLVDTRKLLYHPGALQLGNRRPSRRSVWSELLDLWLSFSGRSAMEQVLLQG